MLPESAQGQEDAVSQRGLRSLHKALFARLRGRDDRPGEFRRTIIWLGPAGSTAATAHFVPPLPQRIPEHVDRLQAFWGMDAPLPPLARIGPCLAATGVPSSLRRRQRAGQPPVPVADAAERPRKPWPQLLTPSVAMAADIGEHFRHQQRARTQGDWEGWIRYFARRLEDAAVAAAHRLERMDAELQEQEDRIGQHMAGLRQTAGALLGELVRKPLRHGVRRGPHLRPNLCQRQSAGRPAGGAWSTAGNHGPPAQSPVSLLALPGGRVMSRRYYCNCGIFNTTEGLVSCPWEGRVSPAHGLDAARADQQLRCGGHGVSARGGGGEAPVGGLA